MKDWCTNGLSPKTFTLTNGAVDFYRLSFFINDVCLQDTTSSSLFASHKPNQDILAAALANTDVFPSTDHSSILKGASSQVSPGSALFPMHVGNVLETSLTLSSPIMTPLEIPSTNSKKIDAEADILSQVCIRKNEKCLQSELERKNCY